MVKAKDRERQALALRKAGATYEAIGARIGVTTEGARQVVKRALAELEDVCREERVELRRLELERLDAMLLGIWDRARKGDSTAIDRVLRIQERRARLMGLDEMPDIEAGSGKLELHFVPVREKPES